ncbi:MAG TPA: glycosyltransferase [Candidatus Nanoarchaeia archaeon]|nr:glycosyltransferase [Candidatus Nanoarchaeia archaeon]
MMKFSIIIPFKKANPYLEECMVHFKKQTFKDFEIILLPDFNEKFSYPKSRVIPTGEVKPSKKRNIGVKKAKGDFVVFIDDDAYPEKDFLENALKYFNDRKVGAVGGPQLTPPSDNLVQHISGEVLSSFGAGSMGVRYKIGRKTKEVNELPTCNLIIRKDLVKKAGYFDEALLTAEDSKLCFALRELGFKIMYVPDVVVYHHRRVSVKKHMRQMYIYARDLAWLLKDKQEKSIIFNIHPLPSLFLIGVVAGFFLALLNPILELIYIAVLLVYLVVFMLASIARNVLHFPLILLGIILTHISYGIGFLAGLISRKPRTAKITLKETSKSF